VGRVTIRGRVASLLEVGTGFHPELTGRENIFLNGAILGMRRAEIQRKFDEIVAFSEVEKFLDTPVKRYSSGMYVRLAFAVAAHLEPEILIVDEVLAVGDGKFQKKCLGKMQDVSRGGRTVLFVSHQMSAVQRLCDRGLLLQNGTVVLESDVSTVLEHYLADSPVDENRVRDVVVEDGTCRFKSWRIEGEDKLRRHSCFSRDTIQICARLEAKQHVSRAQIGVVIRNVMGELLISTNSRDSMVDALDIYSGESDICLTLRIPLKEGRYQIEFALADEAGGLLDHWIAQPALSVMSQHDTVLPPEWQGLVNEPSLFEVVR
jgi:lipopolysaccharide transport system ATP-binding protein